MKQVGCSRTFTANNALGQSVTQTVTDFEVEESDVGNGFENFRGMGHSYHIMTRNDIGKIRTVYESPGHTFWSW